jgi:hypothetical protein
MMVQCVFMLPEKAPDGSGGHRTTWAEGERLMAAITRDSSLVSTIADAAGTVNTYTITVNRDVRLPFHAVIKRVSDGKTFRITSDNAEKTSPLFSALNMAQSTAEEWRLPE